MTASAQLNLSDLVLQALQAKPALTDGPIARGRAIVLARQQQAAIGVRLARSGAQGIDFGGGKQWQTAIVVECACRATTAQQDAHAAVDALLQAVFARIAALQIPPQAGSLVSDPEIAWDNDDTDPGVGLASLILRIDHFTAAGSLSAPA